MPPSPIYIYYATVPVIFVTVPAIEVATTDTHRPLQAIALTAIGAAAFVVMTSYDVPAPDRPPVNVIV